MTVQHVADLTQALAAILSAFKRASRADSQIVCNQQIVWASYDNGRTQWCDLPPAKLKEMQRYLQLRRVALAS
jgi:hypothetical protein